MRVVRSTSVRGNSSGENEGSRSRWTQGSTSDWKGKPIAGPRDQVRRVGFILWPRSRCRNPRVHLLISEEGWGGEEGGSGEMQAEGPCGRGRGSNWVVCKVWGRVGGWTGLFGDGELMELGDGWVGGRDREEKSFNWGHCGEVVPFVIR